MKVFVDNHGVGLKRQFGHHRTDVVVAIVVHDVVGCDEGWHVSACLFGEVGIDVPVIRRTFGAVDGLIDLVGATVVGSDDKAPVVENLIEVAQIVGGSIRGFHWVATLINERVDLKSVALACAYHELPEAGGSYA